MNTNKSELNKNGVLSTLFLLLLFIVSITSNAQNDGTGDSTKIKRIKMTSLAFGGTGILFTNLNDQRSIMIGGRGSATFNNRYTFGGGGWGMPKGIEIESSNSDTLKLFKFGYGGIEVGYILYENWKVRFGSNLLIAYGAGFTETIPKSRKGEFKMFPIFEPSVYSQIGLGKLLKLDIGVKYRFVTGSKFSFINNRQLSGPSFYIAFLVGTCNCN